MTHPGESTFPHKVAYAYLIERNDRTPEGHGANHCEWLTTSKDTVLEKTVFDWTTFGLRVRRHRLFESNFYLEAPKCNHAWQDADKCFRLYDHKKWFHSGIVHVFGTGGGKGAEHWPEAMGIDWMKRSEIAEAIPPVYTEFLGKQMYAHIMALRLKAA